MKKIVLLIVMILGIVGCGVICPSEPPKRAIVSTVKGYSMKYHTIIYLPYGNLSHSPSCTQYEYIPIHIYSNSLGRLNGDEIIWKTYDQTEDLPFAENGENSANVTVVINNQNITISGLVSGYSRMNGSYTMETSSPDSWSVPITGN